MRQLVSIQKISNLVPIEGADFIELAKVLGWQCVVKKGEFSVGDKCVYFEVDSFLPIKEQYEFLRNSSYKNNEFMGEGFRIKTQKLRGQLSQGLALPLSTFPVLQNADIGTDVTDILEVKKWELPEMEASDGTIIGDKPYGIPTTDETRVQSIDDLRLQLMHKPYYISTKMDGTSCSMYFKDGKFGVCGRNSEYKNDGKSGMWNYAIKHNIPESLRAFCNTTSIKNILLQGEFCGCGIQKNRLRLKEYEWYVFNIYNMDTHRLLSLQEMKNVAKRLNIKTVPIEECGDDFNYTFDELLERATGKYESGQNKEGIVIRPLVPEYCSVLGKSLSFKVLNNDFLLKEH